MQIETTNLDIYGNDPLPWSRAHAALHDFIADPDGRAYLSTCGPDGRPHTTGIGALWLDDGVYLVSGPGTRKSRNLAANPACALAFPFDDLDLVVEGTAAIVTDPNTLERIAARYRAAGWPVEVRGHAFTAQYSAPSAGRPPWHLYYVTPHTVVGVATAEPHGATRWRLS
ncbi:pyridoxamine 5'-phosphate oxidase family protein [Nocardia sp. CDC159]|uniref:Pyridoxamine 5'-phosphate oxidase family protein n=1 Tax=Nocardia pulmonis TaxID=2951408 RepID=A0A9X2EHL5_9NOCA|nr:MULTISPECIES: pyridoxamine 5'-phosphate oxidase family protein [Nocardia]MCM6778818.1 pyridoxamine 5'-phosphate oxidase family protein [Nocardia pulmonis]MCM6791707.1 pyridoxamine 5'-phosphate oxidase family protein [Nocardia sp. CDC159]